jgi:hypothetical protein
LGKIYRGPGSSSDGGICNTEIYNNRYYYVAANANVTGWILKIDPRNGDTLWTRKINIGVDIFTAIGLSDDGGCVVSGHSENAIAIKLDSAGNIVWNKTYNVGDVYTRKIIRLSDGNYLMCGSTGFKASLIMKIRSDGNLIWTKVNNFGWLSSFYSVTELNQRYYLTGMSEVDTSKALFASMDTSGNIITSKTYIFMSTDSYGFNIINMSNNLMMICATYLGTQFLKINIHGEIIYEKSIDSTFLHGPKSSKLYNGNVYISYSLFPEDSIYNKVLVLDTLGNRVRSQRFTKYREYEILDFIITDKYNFIFTGTIYNTPLTNDDIYLERFDSLFSTPVNNYSQFITNDFHLSQNYPNPFNPSTIINFSLPKSGIVTFKVYNTIGKEIHSSSKHFLTGTNQIQYSAENLSSGIYFYSLQFGSNIQTRKMIFVK